jgi:hypothetical protein
LVLVEMAALRLVLVELKVAIQYLVPLHLLAAGMAD